MKRALIFGTGNNFIFTCSAIEKKYTIIGLADNSDTKTGIKYFGYTVKRPEEYLSEEPDCVIITPNVCDGIKNQLVTIGFDESIIISLTEALQFEDEEEKIKLAILIYGGMGDFIIAKNWLYLLDRKAHLSDGDTVLFCKPDEIKTVENIFSDCDWIKGIQPISFETSDLVGDGYDLIMWFSIFPMVQAMCDEKIYRKNRELFSYADEVRRFGLENYVPGFFSSPDFYKTVHSIFEKYPHRKYHTHFDVTGELGADDTYLCGIPIQNIESYLPELRLKSKGFITIDTGLNKEYSSKPNVRAWKYECWDELSKMLREKYPRIKIVQIGLAAGGCENICADLNLNGRTDLEQVKVLLKHAYLHIDYEGGLIHLRHALNGGPSVVLMGPTSGRVHNYPENIALCSEVCMPPCEWTGRDWLVKCQKGYSYPKCMEAITPKMVMKKIEGFLG